MTNNDDVMKYQIWSFLNAKIIFKMLLSIPYTLNSNVICYPKSGRSGNLI